MATLALGCECGAVSGSAEISAPGDCNRLLCYCRDCRAFAEELGKADTVLDACGGTEIVQLTPSQVSLDSGLDQVACLRFGEKGLHRWYCRCCNTPLGNTLTAGMPFIGVIRQFIVDPGLDASAGPVLGAVHRKSATAELPLRVLAGKTEAGLMLRIMMKLLAWKFAGKQNPNPLFDETGAPVTEPVIVDKKN